MIERKYVRQNAEEKMNVEQHRGHDTRDVTRVSDPRQVLLCLDCKSYFFCGEHPNVMSTQLTLQLEATR